MTLNCMIIDDEQPARDELAFLLSAHDDIRVAAEADSVSSAIRGIFRHQPDFIFLDIQMPGKDGFDLLAEIRKMDRPPLVIFVTAYDRYAVRAFEAHATDYIMKPFAPERLDLSLARVRETLGLRNLGLRPSGPDRGDSPPKADTAPGPVKKVPVHHKGRIRLLDPGDIVFCQYREKAIHVHTAQNAYLIHGIQTMDQLARHLGPERFFRTHRNTIANLDRIKEFSPWFHGKYHIRMNDKQGTELTVTRDRVRRFKQVLGI